MTNVEKAKALIGTFATGDLKLADSLLAKKYTQHNLAFADGRDAFIDAVAGLQSAPKKTTVKVIREFEDGDYVVLHVIYNFAGSGEVVNFDVFRFENGLIAEHWDNSQPKAVANQSGHTQIDGDTAILPNINTEKTRQIVTGFIGDILRGENPDKLTSYFDGDKYIQHNVAIADGLSGLGKALGEMAKAGIQMVYDRTFKVLSCGDYALGMSEGTFGGKPTVYYDLFRVENGFIAEHWDVMEETMPKEKWANRNGKF
ncbi:MAG: nuclear transport factor 2 family protein [Clostridia bacterium]|nr:nuclear transport factor 2 family protein [Clostridia bacterium]